MTGRALAWRLIGILLLCSAGFVAMLQRIFVTWDVGRQPAGGAAALTGFIIAMAGTLLIINGARLHDEGRRELERRQPGGDDMLDPSPVRGAPVQPPRYLAGIDPAGLGCGHAVLTTYIENRLEAAQSREPSPPTGGVAKSCRSASSSPTGSRRAATGSES